MALPFVRDLLLGLARAGPLSRASESLRQGRLTAISGLTPPAQLLTTAQMQRLTHRPALLIVADNATAESWRETLVTFAELTRGSARVDDDDRPLVLPAFDTDPYEGLSPHEAILEQRALALWRATQGLNFLIVPALSAMTRLADPAFYNGLARTLVRGATLDLDGLAEHLELLGYRRAEPVEQPGEYSIRGGLIDVYSPEAPRPVRVELLGDEIESVREFDPGTQRSVQTVEHALLLPLRSLPLDPQRLKRLTMEAAPKASSPEMESAGAPGPGWEFRLPGLEGFHHSIFDLQPQPLVLVSEPDAVFAEMETAWQRLQARYADAPGSPAPETIFFSPQQIKDQLAPQAQLEMRELTLGLVDQIDLDAEIFALRARDGMAAEAQLETTAPLVVSTRPSPRYQGAVTRMVEDIRAQVAQGERFLCLGANPGEVERLGDLFTELNLPFQLGVRGATGDDYLAEKAYFSAASPTVIVAQGPLLRGFTLTREHLTILGSDDLFQEAAAEQEALRSLGSGAGAPRRSRLSTFLSDFRDLTPGDYVVHVEHGIGRFLGLRTFDGAAAGSTPRASAAAAQQPGEFMTLEYGDGAKLYVPLTRLDLIQKYRSAEGAMPTLDKLGGTQWNQRKSRVKRAMKDMADELLKLYAARQAVSVAPCAPDGHWQREFEDAFPYVETEDQDKAIQDVRQDLESSRPMDRLVVGDVGYGKTEVAMRAAFKVVAENRQVAVLAPTTVLAYQHEQTFRNRFRAFPVTIESLSRFRSRAQQKETLDRLAAGKVDIVIGTHRLLSKDVTFNNLGLVVVDEEQRFGVRHKERLKHLKKEVHVLAMSATPIPRTLNMSLAGLRDLSIIETPPRDRLAIQTVVANWDERLIDVALRQELERGGQVYFVHNRVDSIWEIASMLQKLAPAARVVVGHGQMDEEELETAMMKFVRHEADILVSTTIIENGLDIPLANTMIVNRADRLGLSELYQLRGRVGRSNRRAYAYLLVPAEAELTPLARKRLAAMREFSDLGAGFKLAALDLELRGAGNMLGGEQSGNLDAVGFELYVKMLEQTVRELKGEPAESDLDVQLQLGIDIRIPPEYVPQENQRLRLYKRLAEAETPGRRDDLLREMSDRYGAPPPSVMNLLAYAGLRSACRSLGIAGLDRKHDQLWIRFAPDPNVTPDRLAEMVAGNRGAQFTPQGVLKLPFDAPGPAAVLGGIAAILQELQ